MSHLHVLYHLARADFLERLRRHSFLLTMLFALYLGYNAAVGNITLRLGEVRGVYTSAWIGTLVALVSTTFISLVGFYIVKNSIERDRSTGVGQILAATPLNRIPYVAGKFLSNLAVLAVMVALLALAAVGMQFFAGEDPRFSLWALWAPFLLIAFPAIALVAALAVLFETLPGLRGGAGNVLYFFLWPFGIAGLIAKSPLLDPMGLFVVMGSLEPAARAGIPGYEGGFSLTIRTDPVRVVESFRWGGVDWSREALLARLLWIGISLILVLVAAFCFDRFDSARAVPATAKRRRAKQAGPAEGTVPLRPGRAGAGHLSPLRGESVRFRFLPVFAAELRLALKGLRWWWYAVAAGLVVAQCASPLEVARGPILGAAWIWPVLIWSAMGTRETQQGTGPILFCSAHNVSRQLPASWAAGVTVAVLAGIGVAGRLVMARDGPGLLAWGAGAVFIPSLSLCAGTWGGSSRVFEGLYTALWYLGPINRVPGLDFTGASSGPRAAELGAVYLALGLALLAGAVAGRARQIRGA